MTDPLVLYIAGWGRSGSTLLERLLAEVDGVTLLGEVVHLWERGVREDELCACGTAFSGCPFWSEVGRVPRGLKPSESDYRDDVAMARRVDGAPLR